MNKNKNLNFAINNMVNNFVKILGDNVKSIYIYGSYVLGDFKLGWSDIDLLILTKEDIDKTDQDKLLTLRQTLITANPQNTYYRSFEGAILPFNAFINEESSNVIYWGTKGEKIITNYKLDSFSMKGLIENSNLLYGEDVRGKFIMPSFENLKSDIIYHYNTIREHAQKTKRNFYSFGWFLDISRCLYTLKTGKIISKTKAGIWALKNNLCPNKKALKFAIKVRKKPFKYKNNPKTFDYAETLGLYVQEYANVLQKELNSPFADLIVT